MLFLCDAPTATARKQSGAAGATTRKARRECASAQNARGNSRRAHM